jgi:hypothetical protein
MHIKFKDVDGTWTKVYINGNKYIGDVKLNFSSRKWRMHPKFNFSSSVHGILYTEYFSFYEAAKAMVRLYCDTFCINIDTGKYDASGDTDEFNMKDVFKNWDSRSK